MIAESHILLGQAQQFLFDHLLLLVASCLVVNALWNKFQTGLVGIPGPPLAAYTKLWRVYDVYKGKAHLTAIDLHNKYGPVVRIAPNHVSIADPRMIPIIYSSKETFTKTGFYPLQAATWKKKPAMNLFSARDPEYHRIKRRKVASVYTLKYLLQSEQAIDSCSKLLVDRLHTFASNNEPVDLGSWLQYYAFDVVGELTFARKLGFLEQGLDIDGIMKINTFIMAYSSVCGQVPEYHKFLLGNPLLAKLMPAMETFNPALIFTLKAINERAVFDEGGELIQADIAGRDFLSRWTSSNAEKMSIEELVVNLSTNIFAGSDTTSVALRAVIYFLCRHSRVMKKLIQDIDDANLANPVSYEEAINLPYLGAVVKEAIRLHSSVGLLLERHVPVEGFEVGGYRLPGGTIVGINSWVTDRDPDVFPDPGLFWPERWLTASEAHLKEMENLWEFNFGYGNRKCMGRYFAMIEVHKIIPQLLRTYSIELTHPEKEWTVTNHLFVQQEGLICTLKKR
jgi:cytochrome P450